MEDLILVEGDFDQMGGVYREGRFKMRKFVLAVAMILSIVRALQESEPAKGFAADPTRARAAMVAGAWPKVGDE